MAIFNSYVKLPEGTQNHRIGSGYLNKKNLIPSGEQLHTYGKIHHAFNGETHYFYGHVQ